MTPEQRLMEAMISLGLTRQELADRLGISLSAVAMYATGAHKIRRVVALAVQAEFGVNADWLLAGTGKMYAKPATGSLSGDALRAGHVFVTIPPRERGAAMRMLVGLAGKDWTKP